MIYQIYDVMMSFSTWDIFEYIFWTTTQQKSTKLAN